VGPCQLALKIGDRLLRYAAVFEKVYLRPIKQGTRRPALSRRHLISL